MSGSTSVSITRLKRMEEEVQSEHRFYLNKYKLSGVTELMAFMAGYSVVSIAELNVESDDNVWLLTAYAISTSILVSIATFVIISSAWLLPIFKSTDEGLGFNPPNYPHLREFSLKRRKRLEEATKHWIQGAWILASTGSALIFTLNVIILFWIKFNHSPLATYAGTTILSPLLLLLIYVAILLRRRLSSPGNQLGRVIPMTLDHSSPV